MPPSLRAARWIAACIAVAASVLGVPAVAVGQQPAPADPVPAASPAQPYRGLFGAGRPAAPGGQALDLTASVYQEFSNLPEGAPVSDTATSEPGWFLGVHGLLSYGKESQDVLFGLRAESSLRYYQTNGETTSPRYRAAIGLNSSERTPRRTAYRFEASVDYDPYYQLSLFTDAAPVTGGSAILPSSRDDRLYAARRYLFGQSFEVERRLSARTNVSVFESVQGTRNTETGAEVGSVRAGVRFGRMMSRNANLRVGYAYQRGRYGAGGNDRMESHDGDLSLEYRRALPRARRTTFGFLAGSSRIATASDTRWDVVGSANIRHDFERGWFIQGDAGRRIRLVDGFVEPFFENAVNGTIGGFLTRRVEVLTSGAYSGGRVGIGGGRYDALQGSVRLRLALGRFLAVDAEGLTWRHDFDDAAVVPGTMPRTLNRWAIRCNVAVWLPLFD